MRNEAVGRTPSSAPDPWSGLRDHMRTEGRPLIQSNGCFQSAEARLHHNNVVFK